METSAQSTTSIARETALWILAALAVRLLFLFLTPQVIDSADSILYLEAAQKIADGRFNEIYPRIPLLYSALTAVVSFATRDAETAGIVVSLLSGSLLIAPLFLLSRRMHGGGAARVSALTAVLWPWLTDYACRVAPEALYTALWFASVAAAITAVRKGGWSMFVLPLLLCALYLSRPEGIVIACAVLFAGFFVGETRNRTAARLVPSAVLLCIAVPMHLWLMHKLSESTGIAPRLSTSSMEFSLIARGGESLRTAATLAAISLPVMLGPILIGMAAPGVFAKVPFGRDAKAERALAITAAAQFAAASLSTFAEPRYVMAVVVAIALWSGRGAAAFAQWADESRRWRAVRNAPAVLISAMMLVGMLSNIVPPLLGHKSYKPLEYKIAGRWMNVNLEPGLVLSRKPQVGYYAKMPTSGPAQGDSLDDIRKRVFDADMRYVVVDERYSTQLAPALGPLLDPKNAPTWLRPLKADLSPYPDARIVIYEVVKDSPAP